MWNFKLRYFFDQKAKNEELEVPPDDPTSGWHVDERHPSIL